MVMGLGIGGRPQRRPHSCEQTAKAEVTAAGAKRRVRRIRGLEGVRAHAMRLAVRTQGWSASADRRDLGSGWGARAQAHLDALLNPGMSGPNPREGIRAHLLCFVATECNSRG